MNEEWIEQIRRNLEIKSTAELLEIREKNDRDAWTDEAFIAIQRILEARGEDLSFQGQPALDGEQNQAGQAQADQRQRPGCVTAFVLLNVVGATLLVLGQIFTVALRTYVDEADILGLVTALVLAGLTVAVAIGLWQLKNWARIAIIVLLSLNMLLLVVFVFSGILPAVIGLLIDGFIIYWFATNKQYFVLAN
jgi:hypothetical protein